MPLVTQLILRSIFVSVASNVIRLNNGDAVPEFSDSLAQLVCIKKVLRISIIGLVGLKAQMIELALRLAHACLQRFHKCPNFRFERSVIEVLRPSPHAPHYGHAGQASNESLYPPRAEILLGIVKYQSHRV